MATLQEQRQAIASGMAARRAPTGEAERKATGQRIIEERTGKSVVDDLNKLTQPVRQRRPLKTIQSVGAIPATTSRSSYKEPAATTGGIASPLTEKTKVAAGKTVPDNELWPAGYPSSDGLFVLPAFKTQRFTDANGAEVVLEFANPAWVAV
ncbi:hypothetical protein [Pseudomonas paeninsulae]|uniref:hypothetical protein n=1 Tax=Pseudomonas paeninsulae TaxID=3110772 RepID=UPI002D78B2FB|nr:hypothetical protein [Pseudomonas sp. IT1137]